MNIHEIEELVGDKLVYLTMIDIQFAIDGIHQGEWSSWSDWLDYKREEALVKDVPTQEEIDLHEDVRKLCYFLYNPTVEVKLNPMNGKANMMELNCTRYDLDKWYNAEPDLEQSHLIQNALPMLNDSEREFLITGFSLEEQEELYNSLKNGYALNDAINKVVEPKSERKE